MGFDFEGIDAQAYAKLRAGYAPEAVGWVASRCGVSAGATVIDVGAGTGQLTLPFRQLGAEVWAVDPAINMRKVLVELAPGTRVLEGTAEALPAPDNFANLVVSGQAFHHFRAAEALAEVHRVLRADGALAVMWTTYEEDPLDARIEEIVDRHSGADDSIRMAVVRRRETVPSSDPFSEPERRLFPGTHEIPTAELPDLMAASSDVASLPPNRRNAVLTDLRRLASSLPERTAFRMVTEVELRFRRSHGLRDRPG